MSEREHLSEELNELERALSSLRPRGTGVDRDRLLFLAGKASAEPPAAPRRAWSWQAATVLSTSAAVVLGCLVALRGEPEVVTRIQYVERTAEPATTSEAVVEEQTAPVKEDLPAPAQSPPLFTALHTDWTEQSGYLRMRNVALARGIDAVALLPPARNRSAGKKPLPPPVTYWSELQKMLGNRPDGGQDDAGRPETFDENPTRNPGEQI